MYFFSVISILALYEGSWLCCNTASFTSEAVLTQSLRLGISESSFSSDQSAFNAPQSEWPQTTISVTLSFITANSIAAAVQVFFLMGSFGGTILPTFLTIKSSPGLLSVI